MDVLAYRLSSFILKPDIPKTFLVLLIISILSLLLMGMVVFLINLLKELYGGKYPNPLKSFMSSVSRHSFSKLFQRRTGHGVLGKYFRTKSIDERNHNCECGQLETVEHVLKECPLHPAERDLLRKVSPELDPKIFLDTKKGLGAVVKFLDSLPQLLC